MRESAIRQEKTSDALPQAAENDSQPAVTNLRAVPRRAVTCQQESRLKVQRDSINYFPPGANKSCRIGFFSDLDSRAMA